MHLSSFLGAFLGLYLLVMGLVMLTRREMLGDIVKDFTKNRALIFFSGLLTLVGGLLIVLSHNVWEMSWRFLVTLIGYLMIFQGLVRLFLTDWVAESAKKFYKEDKVMYIGAILTLLGLFLAFKGFGG